MAVGGCVIIVEVASLLTGYGVVASHRSGYIAGERCGRAQVVAMLVVDPLGGGGGLLVTRRCAVVCAVRLGDIADIAATAEGGGLQRVGQLLG